MKLQRFCDFVGKSSVLSNQVDQNKKGRKKKPCVKVYQSFQWILSLEKRYHKENKSRDSQIDLLNKFYLKLSALSKKE
jgi:hypothetical protein